MGLAILRPILKSRTTLRGWLFIGRGKGTIFLPENEEIQLKSSPLILHFAKAVDTVVPEIPKMN